MSRFFVPLLDRLRSSSALRTRLLLVSKLPLGNENLRFANRKTVCGFLSGGRAFKFQKWPLSPLAIIKLPDWPILKF